MGLEKISGGAFLLSVDCAVLTKVMDKQKMSAVRQDTTRGRETERVGNIVQFFCRIAGIY